MLTEVVTCIKNKLKKHQLQKEVKNYDDSQANFEYH